MNKAEFGHRKIQQVGRGSYIISLPKEWVKETRMEKGSELELRLREDSSLVLLPSKKTEDEASVSPEFKEYSMYIDKKDEPESVCRKIIALYVVNSDLIHVHSKDVEVLVNLRKYIGNLVKNTLLGSEIIDETVNEIVIKTLIKSDQFPVEQAIRRMTILTLSALKDIVEVLKNLDEGPIRNIADDYNDVIRLNLYIVRQLKFGLEKDIYEDLGFKTPKEFLGYRIVTNDVKSIADSVMNIANKIITLNRLIQNQTLFMKESVDEEVYSQMESFYTQASELLESSLMALFKRNYDHADNIIMKAESMTTRESNISASIFSKKFDPNIASIISLTFDSLRHVSECSKNIAEVTLNRTIEEVFDKDQFAKKV
jgi:phosphate uptake regulator